MRVMKATRPVRRMSDVELMIRLTAIGWPKLWVIIRYQRAGNKRRVTGIWLGDVLGYCSLHGSLADILTEWLQGVIAADVDGPYSIEVLIDHYSGNVSYDVIKDML